MRANEFVKKFGWGKTKEIIAKFHNNELQSCCFDSGLINGEDKSWWDICVYDLTRLVENYELVEHYKNTYGVSARWFFIANYCQEHRLAPHQSDVYDFVATKYDSYIADVESCQ